MARPWAHSLCGSQRPMPLLFPKPGWVVAPGGGTALSLLMGRWVSPPQPLPSFPGACQCLTSCNSVASVSVLLPRSSIWQSSPQLWTHAGFCLSQGRGSSRRQQGWELSGAGWSKSMLVFPFAEPKIRHSWVWWHLLVISAG